MHADDAGHTRALNAATGKQPHDPRGHPRGRLASPYNCNPADPGDPQRRCERMMVPAKHSLLNGQPATDELVWTNLFDRHGNDGVGIAAAVADVIHLESPESFWGRSGKDRFRHAPLLQGA